MTSADSGQTCTGRNELFPCQTGRRLHHRARFMGVLTWDVTCQPFTMAALATTYTVRLYPLWCLPGYLFSHLVHVSLVCIWHHRNKPENSPDSPNSLVLLIHDQIYVFQTLWYSDAVLVGRPSQQCGMICSHLIAAKIPENPAPITRTFMGRWFSTGSSFTENVAPPALPFT